ncbi:MAG: DUF4214 domain-containing protein [Thermoanaerobaculia bacterium]
MPSPIPKASKFDDRALLAALLVVIVLGAWLRLRCLGVPPLWLDEILNVEIARRAIHSSFLQWLIGFEHENGPLYYLVHLPSLFLPLGVEAAWRLPDVVVGILTLPLMFVAAVRLTERRFTALLATLFLAVSPFHVAYSREGRTYSILVLASVVALLGFGSRGRRTIALLAGSIFIAVATAASAAPFVLGVVAAMGVVAFAGPSASRRRTLLQASGLLMMAAAFLALFYARYPRGRIHAPFSETLLSVGGKIVNGFFVTAHEMIAPSPIALMGAILVLAGFVALRSKAAKAVLLTLAIFPVAATLLSLALLGHWFSLRYVITALPPVLVLAASGCGGIARFASELRSKRQRWSEAFFALVATVAVSPLIFTGIEAARVEPFQRADWRGIASTLAMHARPDDLVIAGGDWASVSLSFYLRQQGRGLDVRSVRDSVPLARYAVERRPRAWVVVGGFDESERTRRWGCGMLPIDRDETEEVRLFYAPDLLRFLGDRATPSERARFFQSFRIAHHGRLDLDSSCDPFLPSGWFGAESAGGSHFRWSGRQATVTMPIPAGSRELRVRASAFPLQGREQRMRVLLDGKPLGERTLGQERTVIAFPFAAQVSDRFGRFSFELAYAASPANRNRSDDERELAAAFDWIQVSGSDSSSDSSSESEREVPMVFVPDHISPPGRDRDPSACPEPDRMTVSQRELFLMRLGEDPATASAIRSRDELARAVLSSLPPAECLSDGDFLDRVYLRIFGRSPDRVGTTYYLGAIRGGWSREKVVCRLLESLETPAQ